MITIQYETSTKRGATVVKEKTFKSGTAYASWLEKNDGRINVLRTERPEPVTFTDVERAVIHATARRIWNDIGNDCGAPDDPEVIAECVMDADRLTQALRRREPALADKVDAHITSRELETIVVGAFR